MDMYPKLEGTVPVSQVSGGVWGIRKKNRIDDQRGENKKQDKGKKEEEKEFEDGRFPDGPEMIMDTETLVNEENAGSDSGNDTSAAARKIDIVI